MPDPTPGGDLISWVLGGLAAMAGALTSTIMYLYRQLESKNRSDIQDLHTQLDLNKRDYDSKLEKAGEKLDECEKDRETIRTELQSVAVRLARLEGDGGNRA